MEALTLAQLLQAVGGTLIGGEADLNQTVTEVCTDSRSVPQGCLFLPLEGERFDGHSFINSALEQGAVGCITARERESYLPGKFYIKVRSTQRALRDLARYYKEMFHIPFVAVTGSVGKTTTKDMVAAVLGERFKVLKTEGNFNNEVGLPLTLLRLNSTHEICVLEMGMNHFGEIEYLSAIVEPDVAVITNIGDSHIENLGSRENILKAKCEIFSHMDPEKGFVILNGDDPLLAALRPTLAFETVSVGTAEGLEYRATDVAMRKTLLAAQQMADSMVSDAEKKKTQLEQDATQEAQARKSKLEAEIAAEEFRLQQAQKATADYVMKLHALHQEELDYLSRLGQMVPPEMAQAAMAQSIVPEGPTTPVEDLTSEEEEVEEPTISQPLQPSQQPKNDPVDDLYLDATRRFDDLQFGKDYQIK